MAKRATERRKRAEATGNSPRTIRPVFAWVAPVVGCCRNDFQSCSRANKHHPRLLPQAKNPRSESTGDWVGSHVSLNCQRAFAGFVTRLDNPPRSQIPGWRRCPDSVLRVARAPGAVSTAMVGRSATRVVLWAILGYAWSIVDDSPLNADQLLGRTSGHYAVEVIFHSLTIFFFFLALWEASKGTGISGVDALWTIIAFLVNSADDAPFIGPVMTIRQDYWNGLLVSEHLLSVLLLYFAVRTAWRRSRVAGAPSVDSQ